MRITAACPEQLMANANHLAMCLGNGAGDANTFINPKWYDLDGTGYSAASWESTAEWLQWAMLDLSRPSWDTDKIIHMDRANAAQAVLIVSDSAITASNTTITVITGVDGRTALELMGLTDQEPEQDMSNVTLYYDNPDVGE